MKIDPSILCCLPLKEYEKFERYATKIVRESFIFAADRDYITARFAFFQKQSHLFLWSAAQTLEKYLKANILLLGSGAVKKTHKHKCLAGELRKTHPECLSFDLAKPMGWTEQGVGDWPDVDANGFLQKIEELGVPDVRYDQVQLEVHLQDLVFLDRLVFRLRDQLIREQVVDCRLVGEQLKQCFFDLNYPFSPADHQHPKLSGLRIFHTSVTTFEAALKGIHGHAAVYQAWAMKSMDLRLDQLQRLADKKINPQ